MRSYVLIDDEPAYVEASQVVAVYAAPDTRLGDVRTWVVLANGHAFISSACVDEIMERLAKVVDG